MKQKTIHNLRVNGGLEAEHIDYSILIPRTTLVKVQALAQAIRLKTRWPGYKVMQQIERLNYSAEQLTANQLLEAIMHTKEHRICGETDVKVNGLDWTVKEAEILGDIAVHMAVDVFDNGAQFCDDIQMHRHEKSKIQPIAGHLFFMPRCLLLNERDNEKSNQYFGVDIAGVTDYDSSERTCKINQEKFNAWYETKLLPIFFKINELADKQAGALVTVPGIGCGIYPGLFTKTAVRCFGIALKSFLLKHGHDFPNVKGVYFDSKSCMKKNNEVISNIYFHVNPSEKAKCSTNQLAKPEDFLPTTQVDYAGCTLVSIAECDRFSFPGNNFNLGYRLMDDGVKCAATNAAAVLFGPSAMPVGFYNTVKKMFLPNERLWGKLRWVDIFAQQGVRLQVNRAITLNKNNEFKQVCGLMLSKERYLRELLVKESGEVAGYLGGKKPSRETSKRL